MTLGALPASQPSSWPAFSMPPRKHGSFGKRPRRPPRGPAAAPLELRIIGGRFRRRKLLYGGDPRVRPMKDRIREAIFNLLGPAVQGKHAIDLFAGTGALALEALSRGARHATLIERHVPTAEIVRRNMAALDVSSICDLVTADVFTWWKRKPELGATPWLVFSSPPYDFYVDRADEMLGLLGGMVESAPAESIVVVECDDRFDLERLPEPESWDVRSYAPAAVGVYSKSAGE